MGVMININVAAMRRCSCARLWAWLWVLVCAGWALPALADTPALQRAYWIDAQGTADIQQAQQQSYLPAPDIMALGYGDAPVWLRVTVAPSPLPELLVMVKPAVLDDVRLYTREPASSAARGLDNWQLRQQGDRFAFSARERQDLNFSFVITPSLATATVFYVRVKTSSSRSISVSVRPLNEAVRGEDLIGQGVAMYLGLVLMLGVFSLVQTLVNRDRLWALSTLVQLTMVVWALMYLGYPAKYINPDAPYWSDLGFSLSYCIYMFLLFVYYREFAIAFKAPRWLVLLLALAMLPLPWQLWALWNGQSREALQLTSALLLFRTFAGLFLVWFFVVEDRTLRYLVRFAHVSQSLYGLSQILPILGLGTMTELNLYPAFLFNLYGAGMQYLVLTRRDVLQRREQSKLRERMHVTEQQLRWEQQRLKESASFMAMLLHELKNPLASIRLALQTLQAGSARTAQEQAQRLGNMNRAIDGIDAVMERCRQVDRFEQGQWPDDKSMVDIVPLLAECMQSVAQPARVCADLPAQLPALIDSNLMRTMVMNLLDNALAYSPPDSEVAMQLKQHTSAQQSWLTLTLRNSVGKAGVPDCERVFAKYYRADRAHQRTGSGLGLFLVKGLAHLAGGDVTHHTETHANGETLVVFELPLPCH